MSQATRTQPIAIPADVQLFAAEQGVSAYLPAILDLLQRLFPDAYHLDMSIDEDPEIANDRHLLLRVDLPERSIDQMLDEDRAWGEGLFQICPAPLVCVFRFWPHMVEP